MCEREPQTSNSGVPHPTGGPAVVLVRPPPAVAPARPTPAARLARPRPAAALARPRPAAALARPLLELKEVMKEAGLVGAWLPLSTSLAAS